MAGIALGATALLSACGSDSTSGTTAAPATAPASEQAANSVDALRAALMCTTGKLWDQDRNGRWIAFTCPKASGPDGNPALLYIFASGADMQLFGTQADGILKQRGFNGGVVGPNWIAFGHSNAHADFLRNAINQGGQYVG